MTEDLRRTAELALAALGENGADMAMVSASRREKREFNVDGGEFSLLRTLFDASLALTGYREGRKGTSLVNRFDGEAVAAAAAECMASAEAAEPDACWELAPGAGRVVFRQGDVTPDMDALFFRLRELMEALKRSHPLILIEQLIASHVKYQSICRSTKGADFSREGGYYELSIMYSAHDGTQSSSFFGTGLRLPAMDRPLLECGSLARDIADVERQIHTRTLTGKFEGIALFSPACLGEVLLTAAANFAGDSAILSGTGLWKDKLGQQVAGKELTVSLRPLDGRVVCGERYTPEGYVSENYDLIRDGVLESFMLSRYVANRTGRERAKNSSGSLFVTPGEKPLWELIAGISRGILVGRLSGGEPGANGEFSMVAKNSFLIEDGRVTDAVSETMINGNLADMLQNVAGLSRETVCDGFGCLPWGAFSGVTVTGK